MPVITLPDGLDYHYRDEGSGPALVLLHGWSANAGFFERQFEGLTGRFRVIAPDHRGHGSSTRAGDRPTIDQLGRDLSHLVNHLGLSEFALLGWSMGAFVAFEYLRGAGRNLVSRLILVDMTAKILSEPGWPHALRGGFSEKQNMQTLNRMRVAWSDYVDHMQPNIFGSLGREDAPLGAWVRERMLGNDPEQLASCWASMAEKDYREDLEKINMPSLVIHGGESALYPVSVGEYMAQALGADRKEMPGSGHSPQLEDPVNFNLAVADFLVGSDRS